MAATPASKSYRIQQLLASARPLPEIAVEVGCSIDYVRTVRHRIAHGKRYSDQPRATKAAAIRALIRSGVSTRDIVRQTQCAAEYVQTVRQRDLAGGLRPCDRAYMAKLKRGRYGDHTRDDPRP